MNTRVLRFVVLLFFGGVVFAGASDDGLVAHLPFTIDLRDHSASKLPVKVVGGVAVVEGAARFDGDGDWLELPHIALNKRPFAVAMWIRVTGKNPMYGLVEQQGSSRRNEWLHLMLRGAWQPFLGQYINDAVSPVMINPQDWTHLVFQHDGQRQQIWINGAPVVFRRCEPFGGAAGVTAIGKSPRWNNVPSKDFEGFMREVRIYQRALRADEIAALADDGRGRAKFAAQTDAPEVDRRVRVRNIGVPLLSIDGNKLLITGEAAQILDLEMAESIGGEWQPLLTLTNKLGRVELIDENMPVSGKRFYRINVRGALPVN